MSDQAIIILCFVLALVAFVVSVTLAVLKRRNLKLVVRILGAGAFIMLVALIYPSYSINERTYAFGLALVQSMCAMLLNANASEIFAAFEGYAVSFLGVYKGILLALLIVAPLFTVGITLSFFSEKFTRLLYRMRSAFHDSFLFSDINERTLCVAEDVARKHKKAVIVFVVRTEKNDIEAEALDRIKRIGASVMNDDIVNIAHSLKHERNYYLLSPDGSINLDAGLRLYQKYNDQRTSKVNMWLYTKDEISEVIFDHLYETFNVRLINEESLIARRLVTDYPLYEAVKDGKLSVLVVGGGNVGLEILRWVTVCSCLGDGVEAELNVIDLQAEKSKKVFEKMAPELSKKWKINFMTADINSSEFTKKLASVKPTYIVIALGNQNRNIETALYIRRFYGLEKGLPHVHALIDHKRVEEQILSNLCVTFWTYDREKISHASEFLCSFEIRPFGSYEETYSDLRIGASYLDCLAVAHNAVYCGITEITRQYAPAILTDLYNQVMFYKDFSDGFAVSISYKLYLMGLMLCDDGKGDLGLLESRMNERIGILRRHEDKRYEAFMRSRGWTDMPVEEVKEQLGDKLKKRNARLDNRHIEELSRMTGRDLDAEDEQSIRRLPTIIRLANQLYGRKFSVRETVQESEDSAKSEDAANPAKSEGSADGN